RLTLQLPPNLGNRTSSISVSVQEMVSGNPGLVDQTLQQVLSETRRMCDRKPDVFVEMEHLDTTPVNVGSSGQRIQKFELGRPCGRDDSSDSSLLYGSANRSCGLLRRSPAQ